MAQVSAEERLQTSLSADEWASIDTFRKFLRIRTISAEGPKGIYLNLLVLASSATIFGMLPVDGVSSRSVPRGRCFFAATIQRRRCRHDG